MIRRFALSSLAFAAVVCGAQPAPSGVPAAVPQVVPSAPPAVAASAPSGEPNVRRVVVEDSGSRIEELRVRGTTQRIVVRPKVGTARSYEILTSDGGRNLTDNADGTRGATGKRVWNVLDF